MSEPALPNVIIVKIIDAVKTQPEERSALIGVYLPLLINYTAGLLHDRRVFTRFRYAFEKQWRLAFPDIPPPDYEGVFNYETLINKFYSYLMVSEERMVKAYSALKLTERIISSARIEASIKAVLAEILFNTIVDTLKFTGEIGYNPDRFTTSLIGSRLYKATPPPFTSIAVTVDLAGAGLDRSLPLLDRFNLVATAVRLTVNVDTSITGIPGSFKNLDRARLCELYKIHLDEDICTSNTNILQNLVVVVEKLDKGDIPITEELVTLIAQTIIVIVTPLLEEPLRRIGKERFES